MKSQSMLWLMDEVFDQVLGGLPQLPELQGIISAHHFFELALLQSLAGADLAAIATGCTPAYTVGVEENEISAGSWRGAARLTGR